MNDLHDIYVNTCLLFGDILTIDEYREFKLMFIDTIKTFFPELNYVIPNIDSLVNIKYQLSFNPILLDFNQNFLKCEDRDSYFDNNYLSINKNTLDIKQQQLYTQYDYLFKLPQPVQKSKEWFDMRNNMITASNCGTVIGECKHTPIKNLLIDKIGLGEKFKENKFVYHGKKYEKIAIMIYENIYNSKVGEFGLIQHPTISYLGASPDGISMSLTLDGKFNRLLGRMLEIKCPPSRKIVNNGSIKGDICPDYYWVQVQIQLECCDLPECDFWQCHLIEYEDEDEFIDDEVNDLVHTQNELYIQDHLTEITNKPAPIYIDKRIRKGAIIELLPKDKSIVPKGELPEWYGKYIYPPVILKTVSEYKQWTTYTINNLNNLYPELITDYKYNKIVYWKLKLSHNELITRQPDWFNANKEHYRIFWNRVLYYRSHLDHARLDLIDRRLNNDIFLKTTTDRIIGKEESIFIKPVHKQVHKQVDEFLSSSDSNTNNKQINKIAIKKEIPKDSKPKKQLVYKNSINKDSDQLDLVMIDENRKKKNINKL